MAPVVQPLRRPPFNLRDKIEKKLDEPESMDIIEKVNSSSQWVSPAVVVPKPNGEVRLRVDMRQAHSLKVHCIARLHSFSPYELEMRAWLRLSRIGVLVLSLTNTSLLMHMCQASVDHHFIISGTYLELGSIAIKNQQQLLFTRLSHRN